MSAVFSGYIISILGDPGAVSWAGREGATNVFKHRRKRHNKLNSRKANLE